MQPSQQSDRAERGKYARVLLATFAAANGIGLLSLIALPFIIGANIASLGLTAADAGLLGTLEFVGVVAASMVLAPRIGHVDRRAIALLGAAIAILANLLCAWFGTHEILLWLRPIAGIGAGLALASGNATLSSVANPERFAGHMLVLFVAMTVAVMFGFSALSERFGQHGVYLALAGTITLLSPLLVWLPRRADRGAQASGQQKGQQSIRSAGGVAILVAVLCFSTRDTMTWAFAETTGISAGYTAAQVGQILGVQSAVGLVGPLLVSWMGARFGLRYPLALGILSSGLATTVLSQSAGQPLLFVSSAMLLTGTYFFTYAYLTALAAELDSEGRVVAATGSALMLGLAIAPVIAGHLLTGGGTFAIGAVVVALMVATLIAALLACRALATDVDRREKRSH